MLENNRKSIKMRKKYRKIIANYSKIGHLKFYHTPRDTKCFWQCLWLTDSRTFTKGNFSTSGPPPLFYPSKFHS